jgi:carbon monoxide dehydrogenase subunit G
MELKGERVLAAGREAAWQALNDIEVLKLCVPGCESMTAIATDEFEMALTAVIGPVKARFKATLKLENVDAPRAYTLKFDGAGGTAGFARGEARVELTELSAAQTRLAYLATAKVGGKLAQVGSRLIDAASGAMADRFFEAFAAQLAARNAPAGAEAVATPASPPGFWSLLKAFLKRLFTART